MRSLLAERLNSKPKRSKTKQTKNQSLTKDIKQVSCIKNAENQQKLNTIKQESSVNSKCHKETNIENVQQQKTVKIDESMHIPINIILVGDAEPITQPQPYKNSHSCKEATIKQVLEDLFNKNGRFRSNNANEAPQTPKNKRGQTRHKNSDEEIKIQNIINHISDIFVKKDSNKADQKQDASSANTKKVKIGDTKIVLKELLSLSMHEIIYGKYTSHIDAWRSLAGPKLFIFVCHSTNTVDMQLIHKFIKDVQYLYRPNTLNAEIVKDINNKSNACNSPISNIANANQCTKTVNTKNNNVHPLNTSNIKNVVVENNKITFNTAEHTKGNTDICNLVTGLIIVDRPLKERVCEAFSRQGEGEEASYVSVEDGLELASKYNLLYIDTDIARMRKNGCAEMLLMMGMFKLNQIGVSSKAIDTYIENIGRYILQQSEVLKIADKCTNNTNSIHSSTQNKYDAKTTNIDQLYSQCNTLMDNLISQSMQINEDIRVLIQYDTIIRYQAYMHIHGLIAKLEQAQYDHLRNTLQLRIQHKIDMLKHVMMLGMLYHKASAKCKHKIDNILAIYVGNICAQLGIEGEGVEMQQITEALSCRQQMVRSSKSEMAKQYGVCKKNITTKIELPRGSQENASMVQAVRETLNQHVERVANLHMQTCNSTLQQLRQYNISKGANKNNLLYMKEVFLKQMDSLMSRINQGMDINNYAQLYRAERLSRLCDSMRHIVSCTDAHILKLQDRLLEIEYMVTTRLNLFDKLQQLNNYASIIISQITNITVRPPEQKQNRPKCNTTEGIAGSTTNGYYMLQTNNLGINMEVNEEYLNGFLMDYYVDHHYESLRKAQPQNIKQQQGCSHLNTSTANRKNANQLLKSSIEFSRSSEGRDESKFKSVIMESQYSVEMGQYKEEHSRNKHGDGFEKSFIQSYKKNIKQLGKSTKKQQYSPEEKILLNRLERCLQQYKHSIAEQIPVVQEFKIRASRYKIALHMHKLLKCTKATRVAELLHLHSQYETHKDSKKNKYMLMSKKQSNKTNRDKSKNKNEKQDKHTKNSTYDQSGGVFVFNEGGISMKSDVINVYPSTIGCSKVLNGPESRTLETGIKEENTNSELEIEDFSFEYDYLF